MGEHGGGVRTRGRRPGPGNGLVFQPAGHRCHRGVRRGGRPHRAPALRARGLDLPKRRALPAHESGGGAGGRGIAAAPRRANAALHPPRCRPGRGRQVAPAGDQPAPLRALGTLRAQPAHGHQGAGGDVRARGARRVVGGPARRLRAGRPLRGAHRVAHHAGPAGGARGVCVAAQAFRRVPRPRPGIQPRHRARIRAAAPGAGEDARLRHPRGLRHRRGNRGHGGGRAAAHRGSCPRSRRQRRGGAQTRRRARGPGAGRRGLAVLAGKAPRGRARHRRGGAAQVLPARAGAHRRRVLRREPALRHHGGKARRPRRLPRRRGRVGGERGRRYGHRPAADGLQRPPVQARRRVDELVRGPVPPRGNQAGGGQRDVGQFQPAHHRRGHHGLPRVRPRPARAAVRRAIPVPLRH